MKSNNDTIPIAGSDDEIAVLQEQSTGMTQSTGYDQMVTPKQDGEMLPTAAGPPSDEAPTTSLNPNHESSTSQEYDHEHAENIMHGINSFWALITPVMVTMLIASFVAVNYRSEALQQSMSAYLVFDESTDSGEEKSGGKVFGESILNALVIIGVVAALTFALVLLYKYNCMKFLVGYLMFASAAILGFEGGQLMDAMIIDRFHWPVDWPAFLFVMYNFAIVGVVAVFYQKGIPRSVNQIYLVFVSVILAWQFSMWPEWTTWIFCCMFAVYDLCAVLTPCGPLKCLIGLIEREQRPMPGLLYEATIRDGTGNPGSRQSTNNVEVTERRSDDRVYHQQTSSQLVEPNQIEAGIPNTVEPFQVPPCPEHCDTKEELTAAIRQFYEKYSPPDVAKASMVTERFFDRQERMWLLMYHKYKVCSCRNNVPCDVLKEAMAREEARREEAEIDNTIKLGLGDFIFYSVLVGRAAMFDFVTLVQSFLCIILGLGGTLLILAITHKALPALPFSIFLATIFYFWTRGVFFEYADFIGNVPAAI